MIQFIYIYIHIYMYIMSDPLQFPVLYSKSLLFIYFIYSGVYLSTHFNYPIPFLFGNHKFVFYVCVSVSVLYSFLLLFRLHI